ncbi:MAG: type II secretion system F family protein [Solirubrobacterales bacterium]|nr:type II secretion system F family protein [Solirubrobacterales bacterium]MCB8970477.1 type II secretion system F family protein [Thermoleophilales bacterium]MCO5325638.1 type II secretion system F family protein [Solirubrobacterales bacterium]
MSSLTPALPILLAAVGGAAVAVALREGIATMPALVRQIEAAARTLSLAGRENRTPTEPERRRLGALAGATLGIVAILVAGVGPLAGIAVSGPAVAGWAVARRQRRYRLRVERDVPAIAAGIADAVAGGGSLRMALLSAGTAMEGPTAVELARVGADLELGMPARQALAGLTRRVPSERIEALVIAVLSQERAGGDLAALLRRHAAAAAQRQRAEREARSATAQARLTGGMVVAMPLLMGAMIELLSPGFSASMLADPLAAVLLVVAAALQVGGFLAIRRLGAVRS